MFLRWLLATFHLLGMAMAVGSSYARFRAFKAPLDAAGLAAVFRADNWWGLSVLLLLPTGLLRAFAGFEKGTAYYVHNGLFHAKLGLLVLVFALEILPLVTLLKWRRAVARGQPVDTTRAAAFARISLVQAHLVAIIVLLAAALARGIGG